MTGAIFYNAICTALWGIAVPLFVAVLLYAELIARCARTRRAELTLSIVAETSLGPIRANFPSNSRAENSGGFAAGV